MDGVTYIGVVDADPHSRAPGGRPPPPGRYQQVPRSSQALLTPGWSPYVHHLARHL